MSDQDQQQQTGADEAQVANIFDLRRIIAGLFLLYGVVLTIVGLGDSDKEIQKAAGVHINLIAGLGMLAIGALFLVWALTRPLGKQLQEEEAKKAAAQKRAESAEQA
jgi:glycerol-3-phosphate responsive antiterminator